MIAILLCALVPKMALASANGKSPKETRTVRVAAAVSLKPVLEKIRQGFETAHPGARLEFNFGASGQLRTQIEKGAPADAFLAAEEGDVTALDNAGLTLLGSRRALARGSLVLVVPRSMPNSVDEAFAKSGLAALAEPAFKHVSIGTPAFVPVGRYAREALVKAGVFEALHSKLVFAENSRQTLAYVELGEAEAALVYATDARNAKGVRVAWKVPATEHAPIVYVGTVMKGSARVDEATALLAALSASSGKQAFEAHGFRP